MPINIKTNLPIKDVLEKENIFVMNETRAITQDIRALKIAILNLMPIKEDAELDLLRALSNTPLQIDISLFHTSSYVGNNTNISHLNTHYVSFQDIKHLKFDGLIITGAPVESLEYEDVVYWNEFCDILNWAKENVFSTLYICWAALAGLKYHYGISKLPLQTKLSGVYKHKTLLKNLPLMRGFDDEFYAIHSRYSKINELELKKAELNIAATCEEAGSVIVLSKDFRHIFVSAHFEYDRLSLDKEYKRDLQKGINPNIPFNYYKDDNPNNEPVNIWKANANCLFSNWLNYYVYQETPYNFINQL